MLAMDEGMCKLYGDTSRVFQKNIDVTTEANLETLASFKFFGSNGAPIHVRLQNWLENERR
jgi:hypothetical protein